jgi:hypothetical protein
MKNIVDRFFDKVRKSEQCWIWTGSKGSGKDNYGFFYLHGNRKTGQKNVRAHRYSYELHNGKIPDGLLVLHKCDTPSCVNPDHLFLGTNKDNSDDKIRKGRFLIYGFGRINKEKTSCKNGHPFNNENTYILKLKNGFGRRCRKCDSIRHIKYRLKQKSLKRSKLTKL